MSARGIETKVRGGERTYDQIRERKKAVEETRAKVKELIERSGKELESMRLRGDCVNNMINDMSRVIRSRFAVNMNTVSLEPWFR